jgi:hypothetical protein
LALFGRRPPERVVGMWVPASENLHTNLHTTCTQPAIEVGYRSPSGRAKNRLAFG